MAEATAAAGRSRDDAERAELGRFVAASFLARLGWSGVVDSCLTGRAWNFFTHRKSLGIDCIGCVGDRLSTAVGDPLSDVLVNDSWARAPSC